MDGRSSKFFWSLCAAWIGMAFCLLSLGGCFYLTFKGDSKEPMLEIHIHLQ